LYRLCNSLKFRLSPFSGFLLLLHAGMVDMVVDMVADMAVVMAVVMVVDMVLLNRTALLRMWYCFLEWQAVM
jgi:hypothetical protein